MADNELERIYTIPLRKVKQGSRNKAANRAVREVRSYLERHMKSEDVWIDDAVNQALWSHGMYKVPSKIRVRAVKFEDGVVEVSLPEEESSGSIRQTLREQRESKAPILPTPGAEDEEAEEETTETAEIEAEEEPAPEEKPSGPGVPGTAAAESDDDAPPGAETEKPAVPPKDTRTKPGDES